MNPDSNLADGKVYVEVGSGFYDGDGNQGSETSATFTVDTAPPTRSSLTVDRTTLVVTFNENLDTTSVPAASSLSLNTGQPSVSSVAVSGKTVTLTLGTAVAQGATVTLTFTQPATNKLKDVAGNEAANFSAVSVTNNTDTTAPTVTFSPANGARTNANSANITLTFDEAAYKDASQAEFSATDLESLIELKVTDDDGADIDFAASINDTNTVVTVNPDSDLADGKVYVEVGSGFYDEDGNQGSSTNATFTVDTAAPTRSSLTVDRTSLVITFNENLDTTSVPAASRFSLNTGQPSVSSVAVSGKTVTLTLATAVAQGATVTLTFTQPATNKLKDAAGNEAANFSAVSVTNNTDTTAPTVTAASSGYFEDAAFSTPLTGPVKASTDIYVKVTFSEDVGHVVSDLAAARPELSFQVGDATAVRFHIVADTAALASGDCQPDDATDRDVYECRYTTTSSDSGDFDFTVGTNTKDGANNALAQTYTHSAKIKVDTTAPTVSSAAYYSDAATTTSLSSTVKSGNDIYTKVTFSEKVGHTANDGDSARPEINYSIGSGSDTQYDIVANTATLASGDCKPSAAPPATVYVCYYKVGGSDSGTLGFEVDTKTADEAGNKLATAWTPSSTLTLEPAPLFSTTIADQTFKVNSAISTLTLPAATGGDAGTTLTYSLSPTLPTGLTFSATNRTITGTPSAITAEAEYTYTVTETDSDSASLQFKIEVVEATAPTVTFSPANGTLTNAKSADITLTFSEAVYKDSSQSTFGASDLDTLIELKVTDDNGSAIAFAASIDAANTVVTVNPSADLSDGKVYVEVGSGFYDAAGNQGSSVNATFTVDTVLPTVSATSVSGSTLTVTFSENMDTSAGAKAAKSAFAVTVAGNNRTVNSYTLSGKTATLTLASAVTTGQAVTVAYTKPSGTNPKLKDLAGNELANFSQTLDTTAPTVTAASSGYFEDAAFSTTLTGPVKASTDIYVKVTFSEDVGHVASDLAAARPELSYQIGDATAVRFHIVAPSVTLASGDCRPDDATDRDVYECRYTTTSSDSGDFDFTVGTNTKDGANNALAPTYTHSAKIKVDTTAPTVSSAAYYSDAATTTSLSGTVKSGNDIYTKVTFSEKVGHTAGDGDGARPEINYAVGSGTATQYDIVANTATLASGDCKPSATPPATMYVCYYEVGGSDSGTLGFEVDTKTADEAGNTLGTAWTPISTLTLEPAPLFSATIADQSYTVNTQITTLTLPAATGGDAGTTLTYTLTPTLPTGLTFSATDRTITGTPSLASAETEYTYTVTETDNDSASLKFKITVSGDGTAPTPGSATVTGATLTVTFSAALDTSSTPAASAFDVNGGAGSAATVSSYTLSGATATLMLSEPVIEGATVTLGYTKPTGANATPLQDAQGTAVEGFLNHPVTNQTDTTRPTVRFNPANAAYTNAKGGNITLTFSEPVYSDASGTVFTDAAAAGLVDLRAGYVDGAHIPFSASMASTGTKANQVITIDPTSDLSDGYVYVIVGRGFFDAAGHDGVPNIMAFTVDTAAPTVTSATADGTTLLVTLSEAMDTGSKPASSVFTVGVSSGTAPSVSSSYILSRDRVMLTLSSAVTAARSPTLAYAPGTDANPLKDRAGNALAGVTQAVSVADLLPRPISAGVDGTALTVTFSAALDTTSTPAAGAFTVGASSGDAPTVSTVGLSGTTPRLLTLTLSSAVAAEQRLTLEYAKPTEDDAVVLKDADGTGDVASFKLRVPNRTTDTTAPTITAAAVSGATVTVTFSEALDTTSLPAASAFAVDVDGTSDDPTVTAYTLEEETATLALSAVVKAGKTATLTYTKPTGAGAKPLQDLAGNDLATIASDDAVTVSNETPETLVLSTTSLEVAEGGTATFTVALSAQPPAAVGDVTVVLVVRDGAPAEVDERRLTFTGTTWNTAQTVTVTGLSDANDWNDSGVVRLVASAGSGLEDRRDEATLALTVTDTASRNAVEFTPDGLSIAEGSSGTLAVRLTAKPEGDVHVWLSRPEATDGLSVSPAMLVFTSRNYQTEQSFTLYAEEDTDTDDETFGVTLEASGGGYDTRSPTINVTTTDTGSGNMLVLDPPVLLTVPEGGSATATVKLSTAPTGDVTVSVALGTEPAHSLSVSPSSLTFTSLDYSDPKTLTFSAAADNDNADDERAVATLTASGGGYAGKSLRFEVVSQDGELHDHEKPPAVKTITALDSDGAAVTTEGRIPPDGKLKVTFSKPVGLCPLATAAVCPTDVTAWTSIDDTHKARLFELVRLGFLDTDASPPEPRSIPFTVTVSGNDVTLTPTGVVPTFYEDEPKRIRLIVRDKYWSVAGGVVGGSSSATWKVVGLAVSVADASVTEGAGAELAFTVRLNRAVKTGDGTVSVGYATRDVTTTAGEDYTSASGTLTFAAGEQEKTVKVAVLEDAHDDGGETMKLVLSNAVGVTIVDGTATGTINNDDHMPQAWLARFGRTVAEQVLDGVKARREAGRTPGEGVVTLAGESVESSGRADLTPDEAEVPSPRPFFWGESEERWQAPLPTLLGVEAALHPGEGFGARAGLDESQTLTEREALLGTSFTLTGAADESGRTLAWWGRAAESAFDGREGALTLDGKVTTGLVGADYGREDWLTGLVISRTDAEGSYTEDSAGSGTLASTLTAVTVYGAVDTSARTELWGAAGHGQGKLTLTAAAGSRAKADLDWTMAAAGARSVLAEPGEGGSLMLALVSDALWARTGSSAAKVGSLVAAESDVTRLRLGLEGSWAAPLEGGGALIPTMELGLRHDGGDAETGFGVELGGGLTWSASASGLALDLAGRTLLAHEDEDFEDWGVSAGLAFDPDPATERGLSLTLRHDLGGSSAGGLEALFTPETLDRRTGAEAAAGRWTAQAAWGFPAFGGRYTGSPHADFGLADTARETTLGWRLAPASSEAANLTLDLTATRRESEGAAPEHSVGIEATLRW